ncbi:VOC family protein [Pelagibacterium luteolum]|uniref:Catechol 2,3-dioxygenase n=1 Tax=Pelagibacterium luteolum TaxID=440168 RepID=A0A1G7TF12_9HYPH|nr:VOC family protein [Pelagibacterium luteolum]SDG33771.1 Catechol 2,3-dioxygenase [Pelagibacterium luteolum]
MIDHFGLSVADYDKSRAFYDSVLATLGYRRMQEFPTPAGMLAGYGDGKPEFWINAGGRSTGRLHIAFAAKSRADVDAFYAKALEVGGRDNGAPGLRQIYHPNYYGAFVFDLDGHNIEAVCHAPG